jgi:hypothetical protein
VVEDGRLVTGDLNRITRSAADACSRLAERVR